MFGRSAAQRSKRARCFLSLPKMQAVEIEEVEVECTPTPRRRSSHATRESPPSSPNSPCPPSPSSPRPPSPSTPTSPTADAGQEADCTPSPASGQGGRRLPNIKLKKQCSKIFRIKTKVRRGPPAGVVRILVYGGGGGRPDGGRPVVGSAWSRGSFSN